MRKFTVKVNGTAYEVEVEEASGAVQSVAPAPVAPAPVAPAPKAAPTGSPVKAPMPGLVLRLLAAEGATVKAQEKIMVVEAMKMETDIFAHMAGKVSFAVKKGDHIETGTLLATIS